MPCIIIVKPIEAHLILKVFSQDVLLTNNPPSFTGAPSAYLSASVENETRTFAASATTPNAKKQTRLPQKTS